MKTFRTSLSVVLRLLCQTRRLQPVAGIAVAVLTLLLGGNAQAQPAFLTNGLVAYYPFNGDSFDATGNGYDERHSGGGQNTGQDF